VIYYNLHPCGVLFFQYANLALRAHRSGIAPLRSQNQSLPIEGPSSSTPDHIHEVGSVAPTPNAFVPMDEPASNVHDSDPVLEDLLNEQEQLSKTFQDFGHHVADTNYDTSGVDPIPDFSHIDQPMLYEGSNLGLYSFIFVLQNIKTMAKWTDTNVTMLLRYLLLLPSISLFVCILFCKDFMNQ
jgi:hypothetical protein